VPVQFNVPPFALRLWHRLTDPPATLTKPTDRRDARMLASILVVVMVLMVTRRLIITLNDASVPVSFFIFAINSSIVAICYAFSRTRHFRSVTLVLLITLLVSSYIQTLSFAVSDAASINEVPMWMIGVLLIAGLIIPWRTLFAVTLVYLLGLMMIPALVPGVTYHNIRFTLEFTIGLSLLITVVTALRQWDLKRIEEQKTLLTISEGRYRSLLEAGFEALIIHDRGLILDVNDTVTAISGYTEKELIGSRTINLVTPDMRDMIEKLYREHTDDNLLYETSLQHKDGRRIDIEARSRMISYNGQSVRVIAMRDITQSKQSSEQIKNLFNSLDRVFYSFSALDSHVIQISPACEKLYGYVPQEFYDDPSIWDKLIHPEDMPRFVEDFRKITLAQHDIRPFRIVRKDGEIRWVEIMITPVYNAANELTRFDGLATDITERRQIEAEQRELQAERERSLVLRQFITDASHDLRTPLATLYTSLYLLRRVSPADDNITRYLNTLEDQTQHLSRVLDDLFMMSRLDSPETYVEKHPMDINQVMDNVVNAQKSLAQEKQVQVNYIPVGSSVLIAADKDYLLVALNHIVRNAVQYTHTGGSVTIRICPPVDKLARIEIADTGIGIQPSEMAYIFDRFYRSDRARKADVGGVGLGLSLARKIVEIHDGTIEAESTPGEGSTFCITLPLMLK
jgi:PAS domain S-box-containing protein